VRKAIATSRMVGSGRGRRGKKGFSADSATVGAVTNKKFGLESEERENKFPAGKKKLL